MTPVPHALLAALDVQARTGQQIRPGQLLLGTPCPLWPVREVINHSIGVTLKFASFAAGHTDHPRAPAGVALHCGDELWAAGLDAACSGPRPRP